MSMNIIRILLISLLVSAIGTMVMAAGEDYQEPNKETSLAEDEGEDPVDPGAGTGGAASNPAVVRTGSVSITSTPPGAVVSLGTVEHGTTPIHLNAIKPGRYMLKLEKQGYRTMTQPVVIAPGPNPPIVVRLQQIPVTGSLTIRSSPPDAEVKIDSVHKGMTPVHVPSLLPDSYNIRVSMPGYLSWIGIVDVIAGRDTQVYAPLTPKGTNVQAGSLVVHSDPVGAVISLDGHEQGRSPLTVENLFPGEYQVDILSPGYQIWTEKARIRPGERTMLQVSLLPDAPVNISDELIQVSETAFAFFRALDRSTAFPSVQEGSESLSTDRIYLIILDQQGTVLADGRHSGVSGTGSLIPHENNPVDSGALFVSLAERGGGFLYDTSLSPEPGEMVSLVHVRTPVNGFIICSVAPLPDLVFPVRDTGEPLRMMVDEEVADATGADEDEEILTLDEENQALRNEGLTLGTFDSDWSDTPDRFGVTRTTALFAAADGGEGYVWLFNDSDPDHPGLTLAYAALVRDHWGIWASGSSEEDGDAVMMVEVSPDTP